MAYFPLFVNIEEYRCLVVGGGPVAYRKAVRLKEYGARVVVVAPHFCPQFRKLPKSGLCFLERPFEDGDLDGMNLVAAATDDRDINSHIACLCREKGLPVNVADSRSESSFLFPAVIKKSGITIGISTGGASPALAKSLKKRIEEAVPDDMEEAAAQLEECRAYVKSVVSDGALRADIFHAIADFVIEYKGGLTKETVDKIIAANLVKKDIPEE